jgi:hypothetical protein
MYCNVTATRALEIINHAYTRTSVGSHGFCFHLPTKQLPSSAPGHPYADWSKHDRADSSDTSAHRYQPFLAGEMLKNGFQDFAYMLVTIDLKMVLRLTAEQNPVQNCKEEQAAPLTHEGLPIDIISPTILCINEEWIIALGI